MGIGRALARGLRDASAGIARGSRNWPQRRAEQARLAQQKEEFDATHALREREQVRFEEDAARSAKQKQYELLLDQVEDSRETVKMYLNAKVDPVSLRPHYEQLNALKRQLHEFTLDQWGEQTVERSVDEIMAAPPPAGGPRGARFGEDEFVSDVSLPPVPEGQQVPLEGPPSVQQPVEALVDVLSKQFSQDTHTEAIKNITKTATDIGADAALAQYLTAMGTYATPKLTADAEKLFKQYALGTLPERRKARAAVITAAIKAAADPKETAFAVWKTLNEVINRDHDGWDTPEEALVTWERMAATDKRLILSGENQTRMGRINAIKFTLASSLTKMSDPDIAKAFGGLAGLETEFNKRLLNWIDTPPGERLTPWKGEKAMKVISVLNEMKVSTDLLSRLQSGAALTAEEVRFYSTLIGSISTKPAFIRQNMKDLMQTMVRMEEGIARVSYASMYGMEHILEEVQELTGNVPFDVPTRTPALADTSGGGYTFGDEYGRSKVVNPEKARMDSIYGPSLPKR